MSNLSVNSIEAHFENLPDPRRKNLNIRHDFYDILVISICAVIAGADDCVSIAAYGRCKIKWFSRFLKLENGIPSHDVFNRVISTINTEKFQECFISWVSSICTVLPGEVVAIDGKSLRRSHDKNRELKATHIVSAWANSNKMVLGQIKTEEKSNEITAIPKLLDMLELSGCLVTIDAMGCQKNIVKTIVENDADYLIAVKDNQPKLYEEIKDRFASCDLEKPLELDKKIDFSETQENGHGRKEKRRCWVINDCELSMSEEWKKLNAIVMIESTRIINGVVGIDHRYFITSSNRGAKYILKSTREHWGIENSLHWVLDIAFREDECRIRKGNGAANFSMLRHISTNLLKKNKLKLGIKNKRLKAGWDDAYMAELLLGLKGTMS